MFLKIRRSQIITQPLVSCQGQILGENTPLLTWLRLGVNTGVWYLFAVFLFPAIQERTGVCSLSEHLTRYRCYKAGHSWSGFDISGHCFLLTWNNLVIIEEIKKLDWSEIKEKSLALYRVSSAVTILLHGLMVIWETMMMATSLYFHSTIEKVLGNKALLKDPTNYWICLYRNSLCDFSVDLDIWSGSCDFEKVLFKLQW